MRGHESPFLKADRTVQSVLGNSVKLTPATVAASIHHPSTLNRPATFLCENTLVFLLATGRRQAHETTEHGQIPLNWSGHDPTRGEEEPEQLESAIPLVSMATTLWTREGP